MDIKRMNIHTAFLILQVVCVCASTTLPFLIEVKESAAIGDYLYTLAARTNISNAVITFSAVTEQTRNTVNLGPAVKDSDGIWSCELTLNTILDADYGPSQISLDFTATDGRVERPMALVLVVDDVNDNRPRFVGLPYETSIPEDFDIDQVVFNVSTIDPDRNAVVAYSLVMGVKEYDETFDIDPQKGEIKLKKRLDFEERSFYHLKVSATDLISSHCPGLGCQCEEDQEECDPTLVDLFITVEDIQDRPPVFERLLNTYYVPEDKPVGDPILTVRAVDGDRGAAPQKTIQYYFAEEYYSTNEYPSWFSLDPVSGIISVGEPLDLTKISFYNAGRPHFLYIKAIEVPLPSGAVTVSYDPSWPSSQTNVSVKVTDVDNHAPEFNQGTYTATVLEDTPSGAPITVSPAIDVKDMDTGENSRFRVSVRRNGLPYDGFTTLPGEGQIIQGSSSVTITVGDATVLDYEAGNTLQFQLILIEEHSNSSGPDPPRPTATATVVLDLLDANDNSPVFPPNQPRSFSVTEDANPGHVIGTVTADDADSANFGSVTFSLEADGHDEEFNISAGGEITLAKEVDREVRSAYSLVVIATDSPGELPSQQRSARLPVKVTVLDANDLHPQWTQVIPVISVHERVRVGSKVTDLFAVDLDQGLNGEIEYSIAPNTKGGSLFTVREFDGRVELSVGSSLIGSSGVHLVKVKATDKGAQPLSSETEVTVLVTDENGLAPVVTDPDGSRYDVTPGELSDILVNATITCVSPDEDSDELTRLFAIIVAVLGVLVIVLVLVLVHIVRMSGRRQRPPDTVVSDAAKQRDVSENPCTNKNISTANPIYQVDRGTHKNNSTENPIYHVDRGTSRNNSTANPIYHVDRGTSRNNSTENPIYDVIE